MHWAGKANLQVFRSTCVSVCVCVCGEGVESGVGDECVRHARK